MFFNNLQTELAQQASELSYTVSVHDVVQYNTNLQRKCENKSNYTRHGFEQKNFKMGHTNTQGGKYFLNMAVVQQY